MNGRSPTMWVTVLQSQPSVSMPTLTMQRTSRPGGCRGGPASSPALRSPRDRRAGPAGLAANRVLPTVSERQAHPAVSSLLLPSGVGLAGQPSSRRGSCSCSRRVAEALDLGGRDARRRPVLRQPLVDHLGDLRVLADQDEHGRARVVLVFRRIPRRSFSTVPPSMAIGWFAYLRMASGLGLARLPPRSAGVSLGQNPMPDVEVARDPAPVVSRTRAAESSPAPTRSRRSDRSR